MSSDPNFQPVFGPNGAVMNAPSMTPEMRAKFDEIGKVPPKPVLRRYGLGVAIYLLLMALFSIFGAPLRQQAMTSPWWHGALIGAATVFVAVLVGLHARRLLQRLELSGPERTVTAPVWVRLLYAVLRIASYASQAVFLILLTAVVLADEVPPLYASPWTASFVVFVGGLLLSELLAWDGRRRGWIIKTSPAVRA